MSNFTKTYKTEISIFSLALLFAFLGDVLFGGVKGTEYSMIGNLLNCASGFFFTVFTVVVLYNLLMKFFCSEKFHGMIRKIPCPEPETKPKTKTPRAKTTSRRIKR